jgi:hypothetical protein
MDIGAAMVIADWVALASLSEAPTKERGRLGVFENRVPRRIFQLKRVEIIGDWRKLHNYGLLHN